jgi:hypothetical protein
METAFYYERQGREFLRDTQTQMHCQFLRKAVKPLWNDDTERSIYGITLSNAKGSYFAEFGQSIASKGRPPSAYDFLACIGGMEYISTISDYVNEFGSDSLPQNIEQIVIEIRRENEGLALLFTPEQLEALQEIN